MRRDLIFVVLCGLFIVSRVSGQDTCLDYSASSESVSWDISSGPTVAQVIEAPAETLLNFTLLRPDSNVVVGTFTIHLGDQNLNTTAAAISIPFDTNMTAGTDLVFSEINLNPLVPSLPYTFFFTLTSGQSNVSVDTGFTRYTARNSYHNGLWRTDTALSFKACFRSAPSPSASATPTTSITPTASPIPSASVTPTPSAIPSPSSSVTPTPSAISSPSASVTPTTSVTPTPLETPSVTPTPSAIPSPSSSVTPTPSAISSPSASATPTTSVTPTTSPIPSASVTPTPQVQVGKGSRSGLGTDGIVAIAVMVPIGVIGLIVGGFLVVRSNRRKSAAEANAKKMEMKSMKTKQKDIESGTNSEHSEEEDSQEDSDSETSESDSPSESSEEESDSEPEESRSAESTSSDSSSDSESESD